MQVSETSGRIQNVEVREHALGGTQDVGEGQALLARVPGAERDHLFRERPALAAELLRACAGLDLGGGVATLGSIDLSQVVPADYRSDSLIVLRDLDGAARAAVIAEVQLGIDRDKLLSWPLYVAAARASLRCPVVLLVLTPDRAVARWARQPIALGHPGHVLCPIVIDYEHVPRLTDPAAASAAPELGVLSAMAHPELEVAAAAVAGLDELSEDRKKLYFDLILSGLPERVRRALEARMIKGYEYQSDFARKYYGEGRSEGLRSAIIEILGARLPGLRPELEALLRDRSEAHLLQIVGAVDQVHDEATARALLGGSGERAPIAG